MKLKRYKDYLYQRLDAKEIAELEKMAELEFQALQSLQNDVAKAISHYMTEKNIGFNDLVRKLGMSASQVIKIQKGTANLTLASLAHIAALLKKKPHIVFGGRG